MALDYCLAMLRNCAVVIWKVFCFALFFSGNFSGYMLLAHPWLMWGHAAVPVRLTPLNVLKCTNSYCWVSFNFHPQWLQWVSTASSLSLLLPLRWHRLKNHLSTIMGLPVTLAPTDVSFIWIYFFLKYFKLPHLWGNNFIYHETISH